METRFPASDFKARNEKQKIPYNRKIAIVPLSFISDACLKRAKPFIIVSSILHFEDASRNSDCSSDYVSVGAPYNIFKTAARVEKMLFTQEYANGCLVGLAVVG